METQAFTENASDMLLTWDEGPHCPTGWTPQPIPGTMWQDQVRKGSTMVAFSHFLGDESQGSIYPSLPVSWERGLE